MRRRLLRLVATAVAVPVAAATAELLADRLEQARGPSQGSAALRRGARAVRSFGRR